MTEKLSVAVIGCGHHGRNGHVAGWRRTEGVEFVAVCDTNRERAQDAAQDYDVPYVYDDPRQLLERHRLDIVSVVTPPKFHKQHVVDALAAGAHVICEKPLAMNAQEAMEMIEAAKGAGKLMTMGLQNRTTRQGRYVRTFIADGGLGHIYHTRVWAGHLLDSGVPGRSVYHRRAVSGSGVLFATMVHALDVANWVIGNPTPVAASGSEYQKISRMKDPPVATWEDRVEDCDIEDFSYGFVRFVDGSSMSLESNWLLHPTGRPTGVEILGDYGTVSLFPLKVELDEGRTVKDVTPADLAEPPFDFAAVLREFAGCIREGRVPIVKFSEMLNVQKIMDAVMQSAQMGKEVEIR